MKGAESEQEEERDYARVSALLSLVARARKWTERTGCWSSFWGEERAGMRGGCSGGKGDWAEGVARVSGPFGVGVARGCGLRGEGG